MNYTIYTLHEPIPLASAGEVRYVGQTMRPLGVRLKAHRSLSESDQSYRARWIRKLKAMGLGPSIHGVTSRLSLKEADAYETELVGLLRAEGFSLVNTTAGGGGLAGYQHSAETKAKIGQSHRGKKVSEQTRAMLSAYRLRRPMSEESRKKMSESRRGLLHTAETKAKIGTAHRGRKHTAEARARMTESHPGKGPIVDEQGNIYRTASDAARSLGFHTSLASLVLRGISRTAKGHTLRYLNKECTR